MKKREICRTKIKAAKASAKPIAAEVAIFLAESTRPLSPVDVI